MKDYAIEVNKLSKLYRIGELGTGTLSQDLQRWFTTRILGKEDPFTKIGQENNRNKKAESNIVYSLKDVDFKIAQGEAVGIVGKNGAGKSTLLKILSRVTTPTFGSIHIKGRVASLLEVGTGFHPELTGRENIYLNGAILGMRKKEIARKLDEIIDFSGVERYIDTPVKRYSSGMYVRLAFAVAAHLESEILIVDEVLAVGDAEFQKKCLGKMGEVSKGDGRTVLFVSHNMEAVKSLCTQSIILQNGTVLMQGNTNECVQTYLRQGLESEGRMHFINPKQKTNGIAEVRIKHHEDFIEHHEPIHVSIIFQENINEGMVGLALLNGNQSKIFTTVLPISKPTYEVSCKIPANLLLKGNYSLDIATFNNHSVFEYLNNICHFEVVDFKNDYRIYGGNVGDIKIECTWLES